jgi:uncharacterized protein
MDEVLQEIVRRIVEVAHPDQIILFGSAARGQATEGSDIDLLVITSENVHRGKLTGSIYLNLFGVDQAVDVVVVTREDVEKYRDNSALVIQPALRDGKIIYDRHSPLAG